MRKRGSKGQLCAVERTSSCVTNQAVLAGRFCLWPCLALPGKGHVPGGLPWTCRAHQGSAHFPSFCKADTACLGFPCPLGSFGIFPWSCSVVFGFRSSWSLGVPSLRLGFTGFGLSVLLLLAFDCWALGVNLSTEKFEAQGEARRSSNIVLPGRQSSLGRQEG